MLILFKQIKPLEVLTSEVLFSELREAALHMVRYRAGATMENYN